MLAKRLIIYLLLFLSISYLVLISAWANLDSATLTPWVESRININLPRKYRADIGLVVTNFSGLTISQLRVQELTSNSPVINVDKLSLSLGLLEFLLFQEVELIPAFYTFRNRPDSQSFGQVDDSDRNRHIVLVMRDIADE